MRIKKLPINPHKADFVPFTGGLDVTSPQITIPPGYCRKSQNYEEDILGGYATLTGYERFDGTLNAPSQAIFYYLNYTGSVQTLSIGATIVGATSGSTAYLLAITPDHLIVTAVTGALFNVTELIVGTSATVSGGVSAGGAIDEITSIYQYDASQYYRQLISTVGYYGVTVLNNAGQYIPIYVLNNSIVIKLRNTTTILSPQTNNNYPVLLRAGTTQNILKTYEGMGGILGVWYYKGITYAFRNLVVGGVGLFASSSSGWQIVNLGIELYYSNGSGAQPNIGDTITQGGSNGILRAITIESGNFAAGTASGRMIFWYLTGNFVNAVFDSGITATCTGQHTVTIPNQNGRFEFVTDNFYGLAITNKVYGVDGKNYGFEFDGATFVQIHTNNTSDTPQHVTVHQGFLVYSFFGSLQSSAVGNPYNWQALNGAAEIGVGDNITGLVRQPGNETSPSLAVYCRNHTYMLYGNSPTTLQLINYNDTAGAIPYSAQKLGGHTFVYDDRGITNLQTTLNFGNFTEATISQRVKSLLASKRNSFNDSHIMRDKQQYRLFFNDGSGVYITLGSNINSFMPVQFPDVVTCSVSAETYGGGADIVFAGLDSGYVVQMEKGTSFDGQIIPAFMDLVFNNTKAYRMSKRYRRLTLEMIGNGYAEFDTSYDLNYASTDYAQPDNTANYVNTSVTNWDSGAVWDSNYTWDGEPITNTTMAIDGDGMNIALKISSSSNAYASIKFSGVLLEYSPQRMLR